MTEITDIASAREALWAFHFDPPASTPEALRAEIAGAVQQGSPVDAIVCATEALYGHLGDLTIAGKELLTGLAALATTLGWHGLATAEGRGIGIVKAARREAGEEPPIGSWPEPEDDPLPLERYRAPEAPPAAPPAEAPPLQRPVETGPLR